MMQLNLMRICFKMTSIKEADVDYEAIEKADVGEIIYSKTGFFKKPKWVIKNMEGESYIFDNFDTALLAEFIFKMLINHDNNQNKLKGGISKSVGNDRN